MGEREQLLAQIEEAKLRLRDLTREIDESPEAEKNPMFAEKLQKAHDCVISLEKALASLSA